MNKQHWKSVHVENVDVKTANWWKWYFKDNLLFKLQEKTYLIVKEFAKIDCLIIQYATKQWNLRLVACKAINKNYFILGGRD